MPQALAHCASRLRLLFGHNVDSCTGGGGSPGAPHAHAHAPLTCSALPARAVFCSALLCSVAVAPPSLPLPQHRADVPVRCAATLLQVSVLQLHDLASGKLLRSFPLPGLGTVGGTSAKRKSPEFFFSFTSFVEPGGATPRGGGRHGACGVAGQAGCWREGGCRMATHCTMCMLRQWSFRDRLGHAFKACLPGGGGSGCGR